MTSIHSYTHVYMHISYVHTYIHTYRQTDGHNNKYVHTYVRTCMHTYIHTYIHTHTYPLYYYVQPTLHYVIPNDSTVKHTTLQITPHGLDKLPQTVVLFRLPVPEQLPTLLRPPLPPTLVVHISAAASWLDCPVLTPTEKLS